MATTSTNKDDEYTLSSLSNDEEDLFGDLEGEDGQDEEGVDDENFFKYQRP